MKPQRTMQNIKDLKREMESEALEELNRHIDNKMDNLSPEAREKIIDARVTRITRCRYLTDFEKVLQYRRLIRELTEDATN